jgi:hypothetical protein
MWRKSSHSSSDNPSCVELAQLDTIIGVRDSKHPELGHLSLDRPTLARLICCIKADKLDRSL